MVTAKMVQELREITGAGIMDCKVALNENNGDMDKAIDYLREKGIAKAAKKASRIAAEGLANVKKDGNNAVILEVNSETDFVAKNEEFKALVENLTNTLLVSNVNTMEDANELVINGEKVSKVVTDLTAKIGEKLSFRRFNLVHKNDNDVFGLYIHMGGKIVTLVVLEGANEEVAKDVAMQVAAMNPKYVTKEDASEEEIEHERAIFKEQTINEGKPMDRVDMIVEGKVSKYLKEICLVDQVFVKDPNTTVGNYVKNNGGVVKSMIRYEVGEGIEKRQDDFADEVMKQANGE